MAYTFSNGNSIQSSWNQRYVAIYDEIYGSLGVRSVYTVAGDTRYSNVAWFVTPTGIASVGAGKKRVEYYDLPGRRLKAPVHGFCIRSVTNTDGTVKNTKLMMP